MRLLACSSTPGWRVVNVFGWCWTSFCPAAGVCANRSTRLSFTFAVTGNRLHQGAGPGDWLVGVRSIDVTDAVMPSQVISAARRPIVTEFSRRAPYF